MYAPILLLAQSGTAWHDGGLFMGMHRGWWAVWIVTLGLLLWAFVRLFADRSATRRNVRRREAAEEALRKRYARGEIDEDAMEAGMEALRRSRS